MTKYVMRAKDIEAASLLPLADIWKDLAPPELLNRANNCFSYACANLESILDMKWRAHAEATPQPGDRSGIPKNILLLLHYRHLPFWVNLAERDGLRRINVGKNDPLPELPDHERLVTITYVDKTNDYHWLRRESNGLWTHKPGNSKPPTWFDTQRQLISDPRRAELYGVDPVYVFFAAPKLGLDVRMKKEWLKFFNSLDDATYGNYKILRRRLLALAPLVEKEFPVMSDYLLDLSAHGTEGELSRFWKHLRTSTRLPNADGLLPLSQAHAPLDIAWNAIAK